MVKIACKCSAGLHVAVIYLQMPQLQSNSSHIYHITSQPTFLPASVTVENHVMPQLRVYNYGSMTFQQDGAPPNSRTEVCAYLRAGGVQWTWERTWVALCSTNWTHLDSWRMCCTIFRWLQPSMSFSRATQTLTGRYGICCSMYGNSLTTVEIPVCLHREGANVEHVSNWSVTSYNACGFTNQNYIHREIKGRFNSENAWYHWAQGLFPSVYYPKI
jgi:hypothetical protein